MIQVEAEAKFNLPLNVPAKLYHVTNSRYLDKILKIGLIPKSKNKRVHHPDRIYFGYTEIGCRNLILQFNKDASDNNKPIQKWSVLEIDTYSLDLTIYTDPDYYDGCWTSDNIPPVKIKVLN
jgi:RNA:NAD 2'-phosphotransferase (TPT1/KptA family)